MNKHDYSPASQWGYHFANSNQISYPSEYVIRIFRGTYPNLVMPKPAPGKRILDVGCGDGRHLVFFNSLGLEAHGVEISSEIVDLLRERLASAGLAAERFTVGSCAALPHPDASFDFVMAWNSAYYMSLNDASFEHHATELSRVVRPGGWLILSVPKPSAFIFAGSLPSPTSGYRVIQQDPFGARNGEIMRIFHSHAELESAFKSDFDTFCRADIHDNCFGYDYHWFLLVARKKLREET